MCPFVERLFSSPTAHPQIVAQQRPMPKCTITVTQLVLVAFFYPTFFLQFFVSLDATLKCIRLAVILSRFGQRPGNYTTIDF